MKQPFKAFASLKALHIASLVLADTAVLTLSSLVSYLFVSSFTDMPGFSVKTVAMFAVTIITCIVCMAFFRTYKIVLKFARAASLMRIICGILSATLISALCLIIADVSVPAEYYVIFFLISSSVVCSERMVCNFVINRIKLANRRTRSVPALIIGAGYTGSHLLQEIVHSENNDYMPVGFVDDDPLLDGQSIYGVSILGPTMLLPEICKKYDIKVIFFAIPSCDEHRKKQILSLCSTTNCEIRVVPSLWELASKAKFLNQARTINVEDVLGRDVVNICQSDFVKYAKGKTVMVTGVGSIGSEICRQVASLDIKKLIMVDIYENNAYDIQQELISQGFKDKIVTEIASVRDFDKMKKLFKIHMPDIVFHAAAHKHVPLMEGCPEEAVKNNILGTYNVATLCRLFNIDKMVLISTDKAVNPTNVMGASKRCCEMIMQYMSQKTDKTDFVTVRFGNVLGSNGSVIPLFVKQIEHGGPVTVTHPDIIRYFMTIPEAVSLVLEAGAMANGGEIFVLDMGEPFKITTLAENLIKLYGYKPYEEMPIEFIGLRPGEKLFEELLMDEEGLSSTKNKSIFIGNQISIDNETFEQQLSEIIKIANKNNGQGVIEALEKIVPTFVHQQ